MEGYKLPLVMAFAEQQRNGDQQDLCRQLTPDELDARVDVGWDLPNFKSVLAAGTHAILSVWRPSERHRIESTTPSTTAAAQA